MHKMRRDFQQAALCWSRRFWPAIAVFLLAQMLLRVTLALSSGPAFIDGPFDLIRPFAIGFGVDVTVLAVALIPGTLYFALLPASLHGGRFDRTMTLWGFALFAFVIGFTMIGEVLFWNEFSARFNFIAVDYLVYTREVVGNIVESYPVAWMLCGLSLFAGLLTVLLRQNLVPAAGAAPALGRGAVLAALFLFAISANAAPRTGLSEASTNNFANELAGNDYDSLVRAFFGNEIDYRRFYPLVDEARVNDRIRDLVASSNAKFVSQAPGDITREIVDASPPARLNVVLVTIESLSSVFMGQFGNQMHLTPNLDALAGQSMFFTNMFATGTRTVRGLEAVTLSVPPTPGQSILRRPGNEQMFSLGSVPRDHGYTTTFIYGGDGYFDNMNHFFESNGYRTIDRKALDRAEITFSNAWGVCDEDIFARAIREADAASARGQPFFQHVMTVSNRRPFTYPAGRIAPPHGTSITGRTLSAYVEQTREGGVRYTDYAIGQFMQQARSKPWFHETLFVFVADHTASSAGKIEVDASAYHIPAIFHAPAVLAPRRIDRLVSQIDIAPTILGVLHMSYRSRFVGQDQSGDSGPERAFISNYQKVGLLRKEGLVLLGPRREIKAYRDGRQVAGPDIDPGLLFDTIVFYQHASHWRAHFSGTNSIVPGGPGD